MYTGKQGRPLLHLRPEDRRLRSVPAEGKRHLIGRGVRRGKEKSVEKNISGSLKRRQVQVGYQIPWLDNVELLRRNCLIVRDLN